jgi:hypothetical protein
MKKLISATLALILCAVLSITAFAAESTTLILKPSSPQIRIGDTITVTGAFSGGVVIGTFNAFITYPASQLEFISGMGISPTIDTKDDLTIQNKNNGSIQILFLDGDGGPTGIKSGDTFKLTFKVIGGNVGDTVKVDANVTTVGDSNGLEITGRTGKSPASMTIAAPLSGNTFLSALAVDNGILAPAFNKNITSYSTSVPFSVSKLNVTATAEDSTSKVSVNSPNLTAGGTTNVSVTVTAQSGAKKVYTIAVKREQDPNYKASSNNNLSSVTIDKGILSPVFSKDKTSYVVWLPYEVDKITVSGTAEDSKATVTVDGGSALVAGQDNKISVICKAEDGTQKTYIVTAKRANSFETGETLQATSSNTTTKSAASSAKSGVSMLSFILSIILAIALGFYGGYVFKSKRNS